MISSPLRPDFWRAQIDNDRGRNMLKSQGIWRDAHEGAEVRSVTVQEQPQSHAVVVKVLTALPKVDADWETDYTVYGSGDIVVEAHFKPSKTDLPKLVAPRHADGAAGRVRAHHLAGPGPQETYCDRKDARFGLYTGTVRTSSIADYTEPGETRQQGGRALARADQRQGRRLAGHSERPACSAPTRCITAPRI